MTRRGVDALLDVLRSEGVRHIFGNPGSTELPFIDALASAPDLHFVLALQEASVIGMADGYAQATRRPAFVNVHTAPGLGNAIGNLTNARANWSPIVVTAGQQDQRHLAYDPVLSGDLVGLAAPVAKWAHEVRSLDELGIVVRRAFHDAASPPPGPVFVSLRMSTLAEEGEAYVPAPSSLARDSVGGHLEELADLLVEPGVGRVAIVVGDEAAWADAVPAIVSLAEVLGAPVHTAPFGSAFPPAHPLFRGMLPASAAGMRETLGAYDRVLLLGGRFTAYPYTPGPPVPETVELLHVSPDANELGRDYPTRLGVVGDLGATIDALVALVAGRPDAGAVAAAIDPARRGDELARQDADARGRYDAVPMDPMAAVHALLQAMPSDPLVVDEAVTANRHLRALQLHSGKPGRYFSTRGGGLGWGMPASVGVSLAHGGEPVLCVVGDGAACYSPQAMWTAAREGLPVLFAVLVNREYRILKDNLRASGSESARSGSFVGLDLDRPDVDFVALARGFGVDATPVEKAGDVGDAVRAALDSDRPHLLELTVAPG
jgi:benzoylformate decarboxylase